MILFQLSWFILRLSLSLKELSNDNVVSLAKKEYGSSVHFLLTFMKSLKSISNEWFYAICWSSILFGIFMIKKSV